MLNLLEYRFFTHAILAALFASISCGIMGSYIVAKRQVFISGGITHASFGGIGLAYFLSIPPILGAAVVAVLSALGIELLSDTMKVRRDSAIGMLWAFGMAVGIIFIYLSPGYSPNLMSYLFGSILTVSIIELWLMFVLCLIILSFFSLLYKPILYISFDKSYAITRKLPVKYIQSIMAVLVALTIVLSIKVAGIILIISLLTIPQNIANLLTNNFRKIILLSVLFAFIGSMMGLMVSYYFNIPSGATIIIVLVVLFVIVNILKKII